MLPKHPTALVDFGTRTCLPAGTPCSSHSQCATLPVKLKPTCSHYGFAVRTGIEPAATDRQSVMLPLHQRTIFYSIKNIFFVASICLSLNIVVSLTCTANLYSSFTVAQIFCSTKKPGRFWRPGFSV